MKENKFVEELQALGHIIKDEHDECLQYINWAVIEKGKELAKIADAQKGKLDDSDTIINLLKHELEIAQIAAENSAKRITSILKEKVLSK